MFKCEIWHILDLFMNLCSKMNPKLRADFDSDIFDPLMQTDRGASLDRCCRFLIIKNSVLEALSVSLFSVNQE